MTLSLIMIAATISLLERSCRLFGFRRDQVGQTQGGSEEDVSRQYGQEFRAQVVLHLVGASEVSTASLSNIPGLPSDDKTTARCGHTAHWAARTPREHADNFNLQLTPRVA